MIEERIRVRWLFVLLLLILTLASLRPIRSYDYFWHLATGRWIVEHGALPKSDPFSVASDTQDWINGEWLFETALYPIYELIGHSGISLLRAMVLALVFSIAFLRAARFMHWPIALLLSVVCWYGSMDRFDARPASVAVVMLMIALWLLFEVRPGWRRTAAYALLTAIWMNVHPSALLAPVLASVLMASEIFSRTQENKTTLLAGAATTGASAVALLLNPYCIQGILAPVHLITAIRSGSFTNTEWLPSVPSTFPVLYLAIILSTVILLAWKQKREHHWLARSLVLIIVTSLAVRHVRNQGLFFISLPFLIPPFAQWRLNVHLQRFLAIVALAVVALVPTNQRMGLGIDKRLFPISAIHQLSASGLTGNIFNADQFGGILIWSFYPERRVVTDGRNELYDTFIAQYSEARLDSRKWQSLLDRYGVKVAVEEYHARPMESVDAVSGRRHLIAPSLVFFPRRNWALIGFDDVAMVFARRSSFAAEALKEIEYRHIRPDDPDALTGLSISQREAVQTEISRARGLTPSSELVDLLGRRFEEGGRN